VASDRAGSPVDDDGAEARAAVEAELPQDNHQHPWDTPAYDSPDDWRTVPDPLATSGFGAVEAAVVARAPDHTLTVASVIDDSASEGLLCLSLELSPGGPTGPDGPTEASAEACSPPTAFPQIAPFGLHGVEDGARYVFGMVSGGETEVQIVAGASSETVSTIVPDGFDGTFSVFVAALSGDEPVQDIVPSSRPGAAELGLTVPFAS